MEKSSPLDAIVDALVEAGVLEADSDDDLSLTDDFREVRSTHRERIAELDEDEFGRTREPYVVDGPVSDVGREDVADAEAIGEMVDSTTPRQRIVIARALARYEDPPPSEGAPTGSVPIHPWDVQSFIEQYPVSIVYFWREDCGPCDEIRKKLETVVDEPIFPECVGFGAVYGPEDPAYLREQFDVGIAPTTLFCVDGTVDSRLVGDHTLDTIRQEVEIIAESLPVDDERA